MRLWQYVPITLGFLAPALMPFPASAQAPKPVLFETYTLPNGLTVILAEDHAAQVVAVDVWYRVGARNERPGRTGFAHLFEHMMFQGSENVPKSEHLRLVERAGGAVNGSTTEDRTNYFQVVPSNRMNLALWLEADRMRSLVITDSTLANQTEAVKEERRLRVDNQPYVGAFQQGLTRAYDSTTCFGYAHETIGSMADLDAATTADVQAFFDQYYAPNNATLTVVGDFDPTETKELISRYFGGIPRGNAPPPVECGYEFSPGRMALQFHDPKANLPAVLQVYRVPPLAHADSPALQLLGTLLGQGESSRLNRKLVRETRAAAVTQAFSIARLGPGHFALLAIANVGVPPDSVAALLTSEVTRLGTGDGVTEEELEKAKAQFRSQLVNGRQRALNLAEAFQQAMLHYGTPDAINREYDRMMAVTLDDIRRVVRTYLVPANVVQILISSEPIS